MSVDFFFDRLLKEIKLLHPHRMANPDEKGASFKAGWQRLLGKSRSDDLRPLLLQTPTGKAIRELRLAILQQGL